MGFMREREALNHCSHLESEYYNFGMAWLGTIDRLAGRYKLQEVFGLDLGFEIGEQKYASCSLI